MTRKSVQSSAVSSIGYNRKAGVLEIEFNNGSVYQYFGMPKNIFRNLIHANSIGAYVNKFVKQKAAFFRRVK
jgi:hypothetical protein